MLEITKELSHKEELLLSRFVDGECGILGRFLARRLMATNQQASQLVAQFQNLSSEISINQDAKLQSDLWNKIAQRIDQEEKAELYLGQRSVLSEKPRYFSRELMRLGWGLSGGLATAAVGFFIFKAVSIERPIDSNAALSQRVASSAAVAEDARAYNNIVNPVRQVASAIPQFVSRPVEVDWMRSDGRVRMIQNQGGRSAVIWVKRSDPIANEMRPTDDSNLINSLFGTNDKIFQSREPVILEERVPNSISVSNNR